MSWALRPGPRVLGFGSVTYPCGREAGPPNPRVLRRPSPDSGTVSSTSWDLACSAGREPETRPRASQVPPLSRDGGDVGSNAHRWVGACHATPVAAARGRRRTPMTQQQ